MENLPTDLLKIIIDYKDQIDHSIKFKKSLDFINKRVIYIYKTDDIPEKTLSIIHIRHKTHTMYTHSRIYKTLKISHTILDNNQRYRKEINNY